MMRNVAGLQSEIFSWKKSNVTQPDDFAVVKRVWRVFQPDFSSPGSTSNVIGSPVIILRSVGAANFSTSFRSMAKRLSTPSAVD